MPKSTPARRRSTKASCAGSCWTHCPRVERGRERGDTNKLSAVVRGSMSLGSIMQRRGYKTVPSLQHPDPNGGGYFTGGFNSKLRGSRLLAAGEAGAPYVDAIQVRINKGWR